MLGSMRRTATLLTGLLLGACASPKGTPAPSPPDAAATTSAAESEPQKESDPIELVSQPYDPERREVIAVQPGGPLGLARVLDAGGRGSVELWDLDRGRLMRPLAEVDERDRMVVSRDWRRVAIVSRVAVIVDGPAPDIDHPVAPNSGPGV